jgi:hypothetical protein
MLLTMLACTQYVCASDKGKEVPEKVINVVVNEEGFAYIGRDTLPIKEVSEEIHLRLWKGYLGTGNMPSQILVKYLGNGQALHQEAIEKAVKEAQQKTLQKYCVQKHKKRFEDISSNQQQKIKKHFPVLFQTSYAGEAS